MSANNSTMPAMVRVGDRFGRLTVVEFAFTRNGNKHWRCGCDCGTERIVHQSSLRAGYTVSCGCRKREAVIVRCTKHGHWTNHGRNGTRTFHIWWGMIHRCHYPKTTGYANYGGRGIRVCDRWRESFKNFLADMGERPSPDHQIDRIDNDGPYSPDNCRWATRHTQRRNTRSNRLLTFAGKTQCLTDWARELGINKRTLGGRLGHGWSVERALATPTGNGPAEGWKTRRLNAG